MAGRTLLLPALMVSTVHGWAALHVPAPPAHQPRARAAVLQLEPFDASTSGAATGEEIAEEDKTEGIPNYMLRNAGTVSRLAEGADSCTIVQDDGAQYEPDCMVSIITSDVIDMVQQQAGEAEKVDYLGENILVEGLLFDDFMAEDTFQIASPDAADGAGDVVTLEIVEARPSSAVELGQLGDDESKRQSIASMLSLAPGFSGWTARVTAAGRVQAGFKISKRSVAAVA